MRKITHEDQTQDISERINFTDFESRCNLEYIQEDPEILNLFTYFKLSDSLLEHLAILKATKPKNNILYNYITWKDLSFE